MNRAAARPLQFSIATMLLVMTLIGMCLAVLRFSEFWGVAALLMTGAALVRCAIVGFVGPPEDVLTIGLKVDLFVESVAVVLFSLVAAGVGYLCGMTTIIIIGQMFMVRNPGTVVIIMAVLAGVVPPVAAFVYSFWKLTFPVRM